jgi:hypothetical protein
MKKNYEITNYELIVGRVFEKKDFKYQILDYNKINNVFVYSKETIKGEKYKTYSSINPSDLLILMSQEN